MTSLSQAQFSTFILRPRYASSESLNLRAWVGGSPLKLQNRTNDKRSRDQRRYGHFQLGSCYSRRTVGRLFGPSPSLAHLYRDHVRNFCRDDRCSGKQFQQGGCIDRQLLTTNQIGWLCENCQSLVWCGFHCDDLSLAGLLYVCVEPAVLLISHRVPHVHHSGESTFLLRLRTGCLLSVQLICQPDCTCSTRGMLYSNYLLEFRLTVPLFLVAVLWGLCRGPRCFVHADLVALR